MTRVVLVPGVLALLPEYAGLDDPVRDLRAACLSAVAWLGEDVEILADRQGERVGRALLEAAGVSRQALARLPQPPGGYLVVANGSARRTEKAPGHLDERAFAFDDGLREWLFGRGAPPDPTLAAELLASTTGFALMAERVPPWGQPVVDFDDDPFGVQYWVLRWQVR